MKNTKEVSELYMYLSDFITKIDTNYKELDLEYSQKLKEVTVANE